MKCDRYVVSCSVLEGFECCRCCGISDCEDDRCPSDEKLPTSTTREELYYLQEISWIFNYINNAKDSFLDGRFNKHYYSSYESAKNKFTKLQKLIEGSQSIRPHMKTKMTKQIKEGISSCKDMDNLILNKLGLSKKKGNFKYFKRNLDKFSKETIGSVKRLSRGERYRLLKNKGVKNPLPMIK